MVKNNLGKSKFTISLVILFLILITIIFVNYALANHVITTSNGGTNYNLNENTYNIYNITVNNTDDIEGANISAVNITIPSTFNFTLNSNGTNAGIHNFTNTSTVLNWKTDGLIMNLTYKYFWFNVSAPAGNYNITIITKNATGFSSSNITVTINDTTVPVIALNAPANATTSTTNTYNFTFNVSDRSTVSNCSLIFDSTVINRLTSVSTSAVNGLYNTSLLPGVHIWSINCTDSAGNVGNSIARTLTVTGFNFTFSGYILNSTGSNQSNANISIYKVTMGQIGPPVETLINSTNTSSTGFFKLWVNTNGQMTNTMFRLKLAYYNASNPVQALETGPSMPEFPMMMFDPTMGGMMDLSSIPEYMRPPNLNGSNFNLQPAITLNITAQGKNESATINQRFGYEIMDLKSGFPIQSKIQGNETYYSVVVPAGRNYNIMALRQWGTFTEDGTCNGNFFNDTHCPSPPKSNASLGSSTTTGGEIIQVVFNLTESKYYLSGCINVSGNSTAVTNITQIFPKMLPFPGFVPPMKADDESINLSNTLQLNYSDLRCSGQLAWYNISLLDGNYLIEFYGSNNKTNGANGQSGYTVGAVQNLTLSANTNFNITLMPMLGDWYTAGLTDVNTTKVMINVTNATGGALTQTPHMEMVIYYPHTGKLHYFFETSSGAASSVFYFPIINMTGAWARVNIFPQGPPIEKKLNLTRANQTIAMEDDDGFGFKKIDSNGNAIDMNITESPIRMKFWRNSASCNVVTPNESSCLITSMNAENFNPLKVMLAGKVNLEMTITATNVSLMFMDFDMFNAKPPTNSIFDENAESSSGQDVWKFGSFAPKDAYKEVLIKIPYNTSTIDESASINASVPVLYDENNNVVWNRSAGYTQANLTTDYLEKTHVDNSSIDYSYNSTGFRNFLNAGGQECNKTNNNMSEFYCHVNTTTNMIYMRLPHFSTVSPTVTGQAISTSTSSTSSSSSGGSVITTTFWTKGTLKVIDTELSQGISKLVQSKQRLEIKVNDENHHVGVISVDSNSVIVNVSSLPQQATLYVGQEKKFEVNEDRYYDVLVRFNGIVNNFANITVKSIHEELPIIKEESMETSATGNIIKKEDSLISENEKQEEASSTNSNWKIWVIVLIILVILIVVLSIIYYQNKHDYTHKIKYKD
ncbi:MAG: hypothetical protein ACOYT4_04515 [Nanoarchaeota archaeon]